ncbi:hypothetical protein J056_004368 [Wallemia ichthyophaga EXF-994]|uniref:Uncharacterized protein n=1 Tax=Wallemia ichthyophaga (strain EXF-994 / CBS 113033) TaxID=1299270 RepID=R9A937_WALI9|nr:uncharacterized protein J056_004368 [Wallemia ichthyophaga EXF-994]EOQ98632.1 hypothetical protein J056_004368 [Wallemia ichthyophaga EXF-994]
MNFQLGHFNSSDKPPFITSNVSSTESVNALADISSLDFSGVTNFNRNNTHNNAHKDPFKKFISITLLINDFVKDYDTLLCDDITVEITR